MNKHHRTLSKILNSKPENANYAIEFSTIVVHIQCEPKEIEPYVENLNEFIVSF